MAVEFGLLGELRLTIGERELSLGGPRQRALIARLLVSRNEAVPRDRLQEDLYPEARSGPKALQVAVSRLREVLAQHLETADRLQSTAAGYRLRLGAGELDVDRFDALLSAANAAFSSGAAHDAIARLQEAVDVWRGPALYEFSDSPWARAKSDWLEERRLEAIELRVETELSLGIHDRGAAELEQLVASYPARERLSGTLMRALYMTGRQADALAVYRQARRHLVEQHGIEPGSELRELHQAMLVQDPSVAEPPPRQLAGAKRRHSSFSPVPDEQSGEHPFVGRVVERAALNQVLERAQSRERVAAFVEGEAGIGKTRLAEEIIRRARGRGFTVLCGGCDENLQRPFGPFVEALNAQAPTDEGRLQSLGAHLAGDRAKDATADVGIAGSQQYSLFASVGDLLAAMGRDSPVLLSLEDLQWADDSTLLLLGHLLTTPVRPRLMVLATYRHSDLGADHPLKDLLADLHGQPQILRLELQGLLNSEVAELVGVTRGGKSGIEIEAASALRRATGGNPFFLTEVMRSLDEIDEDLDRWIQGGESSDPALPLPRSLRETIQHRVARLGEPVADALRAAAILGVDFDARLLEQVLGCDPRPWLDAAQVAGLVQPVDERLTFRHALIRQTLYEELSPPRRADLHRRAALALESQPSLDAATLARHWIHASPPRQLDRAIHWSRQAADQALKQLAPQRAQRWYEQILELQARQPDTSDGDRCAALIGLGAAQRHSGDPTFRETLLEAARIAHRRRDADSLIRAVLGNTRGFVSAVGDVDHERIAVVEQALEAVGPRPSSERARLLATLASELSFSGDWDRRVALSDEALRIARDCGDLAALVHVLSTRNFTIWRPETLGERFANSAECRAAADLLGDPLAQFHALYWRASACVQCGEFAEAQACRERARRIAERIRQPLVLWMTAYDDADEHLIAGRIELAEQRALAAAEIGQAIGQPDAPLNLAAQLIVIRYDQGRLGELTELIAQTIQSNPRLTGFRSVLATALCEQRRYDEAANVLALDSPDRFANLALDLSWLSVLCMYAHVAARLLPLGAVSTETAMWLRELLTPWDAQIAYLGPMGGRLVAHHLGELEVAQGNLAAGRSHLEASLRQAELLPAPVWALRSRIELARCLMASHEYEEARELLGRSSRDADALGCAGLAREADELNAAAGSSAPAGRS